MIQKRKIYCYEPHCINIIIMQFIGYCLLNLAKGQIIVKFIDLVIVTKEKVNNYGIVGARVFKKFVSRG